MPSQEEIYASLCQRHGKALQDKLQKAKVAIAGLGGLGSNIAPHRRRTASSGGF